MNVEIGSQLGTYRVVAPLGAGGMGEVYRATDPRLDREVAIKVLPKGFSEDSDRLRRFIQEAKTLASLSHPNILVIHDTGVQQGQSYLVCELLEGKTLRAQLEDGPIPVRKAIRLAVQAAQGLAAAHSKGVIHRDLKPENLFITNEDHLKILDFGLAKLRDSDSNSGSSGSNSGVVDSPTVTAQQSTEPGCVLGTPSYMSPEQVRGEPVDQRTDIFAFGCVLFEMLTGKRCFQRDSAAEVMTAILREDAPELTAINLDLSPTLEQVVQRCLNKEPERRFQTATDLGFAIETIDTSSRVMLNVPDVGSAPRVRVFLKQWLPWALAAVAIIVAVYASVTARRVASYSTDQVRSAPRRFELHLPDSTKLDSIDEQITDMTIAPDGRKFVYVNSDGLWLRWLDRLSSPDLLVAASNDRFGKPIWSPRSDEIAFLRSTSLYRLSITGGQPKLICRTAGVPWPKSSGGSWFPDDRIFFTLGRSDLYQVSARGGEPKVVLARGEQEMGLTYANPLPDARGVLFVSYGEAGASTISVWTPNGGRKLLLNLPETSLAQPTYAPSGHVIYERRTGDRGGIWAFPFSITELERNGEPMLITDQGIDPSTADDGALLLNLTAEARRQLTWVDRKGQIIETIGQPRQGLSAPRLSKDERRVAVSVRQSSNWDVWIADLDRGVFIPAVRTHETDIDPYWYPDGNRIAFRRWTRGKPRVFVKTLDGVGAEEELFEGFIGHLSPSGKHLILVPDSDDPLVGHVTLDGPDLTPIPFPKEIQDLNPKDLRISPNDRLLAFGSSATGRHEVYLVDFPSCAIKNLVSQGAGRGLEWHPDGSELFYWGDDMRSLWSVKINGDDAISVGEPTKVFDLQKEISNRGFQVTADGERFLMLQYIADPLGPDGLPKSKALLIEDWFADFRGQSRIVK